LHWEIVQDSKQISPQTPLSITMYFSPFRLSWMPQVDFVLVTVVWEYCSAGIGVTNLGHCHPRVTEAVREQLGKLWHAQVRAGKQHWRANDQITDIRTMLHLKVIETQEVPRTS
jgi:hypothetical protein